MHNLNVTRYGERAKKFHAVRILCVFKYYIFISILVYSIIGILTEYVKKKAYMLHLFYASFPVVIVSVKTDNSAL